MEGEVQKLYKQLLSQGRTPKDAAREAQQRTGMSVVTGAPIRQKKLKFTSKGTTYGQQTTFKKPGLEQGFPGQYA